MPVNMKLDKHLYHGTDESSPCEDHAINEALTNFIESVSDGISMLVIQLGYSPLRASESILNELSGESTEVNDDEVFAVMKKCGVCFDDAIKIVIVSKCLTKTKKNLKLSNAKAIHHLSSKLDPSVLVGKHIDRRVRDNSRTTISADDLLSVPETDTFHTLSITTTADTALSTPASSKSVISISSSRNVKIKVPSRVDLPPKCSFVSSNLRNPSSHEPSANSRGVALQQTDGGEITEDIEAKVAEKAFNRIESDLNLQKLKAQSPTVPSSRSKRAGNHRPEDPENLFQQPPVKRTRTESF